MTTWLEIKNYLDSTEKPVQLVKHIDEVPESKLKWPAIVQVKEDGVCAIVIKHNNLIRMFTRTGKEMFYSGLYCLNVQRLQNDFVYIAELINPKLSLEALSGLVNPNRVEAWDTKTYELMLHNATLRYHDIIKLSSFLMGRSVVDYYSRLSTLLDHVSAAHVIPYTFVHSDPELQVYAAKQIASGKEGVVRKEIHAPWIAGHKGHHSTKIVRDIHVDLQCTAVKYGKPGKHQHWIAALEFVYGGKSFWADLGKGWDNEKRDYLTKGYEKNKFNVIGQIFHVKALQESSKGVLRLPKVQEQRIDKVVQDD